ncbi:MAG: T9SS type A sorting domain-containing protein [Bacteroidetes bacterium]|jgi:hypothetical protein|nr:T9SS type A sorting domain-containing protein [Bacteroidota bacterium]MCK4638589.1 T9SS type A sorting domain-containing protein [Bacteroidales bacterium]
MKTILFIIAIILTVACPAQIPGIQWQQCYGSSEMDKSYGIAAKENGYLLAIHIGTDEPGITNYHGLGDIWIVNTDSSGNIVWERCFGGSSGDVPQKIKKANDNEYYIYGYTFSTDGDVQSGNNGYSDLWVVKINGQGDLLWEQTYGCTGYDEPRDMILTPDGGFVMIDRIGIGGGDVTNFYGSGDVWMCKCDSLGNIEWEKTLGNQWLDSGVSMILNSEGNIMMIGATAHYGGIVDCNADDGYGDVWLVELNLSGEILWQRCYGGSYYDLGYDIKELEDGYIFTAGSNSNDGDVTGHHGPAGNAPDGWPDIWVVNIDNQGSIIWQKSLGGTDSEYPKYLTQTAEGGILVIGTTYSNDGDVSGNHSMPGGYDMDIWVVKLSPEGEIEWQHCYGGWGTERLETPHTILKKGDYNYVIASSTDYKSGNDDIQCDIHANGDRDVWVFEIEDTSTNIINTQKTDNAIKVYPNPATDYVVFKIKDKSKKIKGDNVIIRISNVFGEVVTTLPIKNNQSSIKNQEIVWDTRNIKSGVYFYNLNLEGFSKIGKIVISK